MKTKLLAAVGAVALLAGVAIAQTVSAPLVTSINSNDAVHIVPRAVPTANSVFMSISVVNMQGHVHHGVPTVL